jgi:hypothetical protein
MSIKSKFFILPEGRKIIGKKASFFPSLWSKGAAPGDEKVRQKRCGDTKSVSSTIYFLPVGKCVGRSQPAGKAVLELKMRLNPKLGIG